VIELVEKEIHPSSVLRKVHSLSSGALVLFLGMVRSSSNGKKVSHLVYEAYHDMALKKLEGLVEIAMTRWELGEVAVIHRLGRLEVGEISLLIAVSSPHRAESFEASRFLIEEIKKEVPIWKKEFWAGGERWV
jgi:molybdopterin synthase catalytic subunit